MTQNTPSAAPDEVRTEAPSEVHTEAPHANPTASSPARQRIMVGISGGVDSSVTAYLLQEQGYDVHGLFMKNWEEDDDSEHCSAHIDLEDASQICETLNIPLHTRNFATEYWDNVFHYFLEEYRIGRTPNPDVLCNKEIKFKVFLEQALELGASHIATGHYAQVKHHNGYYRLLKAKDTNKDQTYFLHALNQQQLSKAWFPLGELTKPEVRRLAEKARFANHAKKDSTGICFIGERKFKDFLSQYLPAQPGEMHNPDGKLIGQHDGLMFYTLGQRQGLGIGGSQDASGEPWYVVGKNLDDNILRVAQGHNHPLLFRDTLMADQLNWISETPQQLPYRCTAKTRYRQADQDCTITHLEGDLCTVSFDEPQRAITPGQSVVFYQDDECLGGGVIR
ncbi:MAG: tRNA 2-thiouridine(34) synthase MnmA [Ectothiorhodospiraceae bacterium]|nr:tRNA 2-thiouridine(34) synthase MnmA [Ectothiorhodospiraceae bacterium]